MAGDLMVFSAISSISLFEADTDDSVDDGQETNDYMLCCAILMQSDLE